MSLICLFTLVAGSSPRAFADDAEYPENIDLVFVKGSGDDHITLSNGDKAADYDIKSTSQTVSVQLRISLNKKYEEGQLRIVIPFRAFTDRDGGYYHMMDKATFLTQINQPTSMLKLVEDNSKRTGEDSTIVLTNLAASAPQIELDFKYEINAFTVKDNASQDFKISITDTKTGEDRSPEKVTATFRTHVRNASLTKNPEDYGVKSGCYYAWNDILETRYKLTSKYGITPEKFAQDCENYDYIGYRLVANVDRNQSVTTYIKDTPQEGGEVVAVSRMSTYKDCTALDKETEGPYAGYWKYNTYDNWFLVLVKYPKSMAEDPSGNNPYIKNEAEIVYVGVDGDENDAATATDDCISVWQGMGAVYAGDIWSVEKESNPDPSGALNLLRAGKDATFGYTIKGIGKTYKYGAVDGYTYKNGPYWMEVVDDAMYVNGLGDDGKTNARLTPDDFHFKTFTMEVIHKNVSAVSLDMEVSEYEYRPIIGRDPVEVYVMTQKDPDIWQLDQYVTLPKDGTSKYTYVDENGSEVFAFQKAKDGVYRVKFVYRGANGDIELISKLSGVLRGTGTTVKKVLENMKKIKLENFQLFNWDGQMGYDGNGVWENPNDANTVYSSDPWVKQDLLAMDAQLYEGHSNEAGSVRIAKRLSARNNITGIDAICGSAKTTGYTSYTEDQVKVNYTLAAMTGKAGSEEDLRQLIDLGVIKGSKEVVFHELLPPGMYIDSVVPVFNSTYLSDNPKEYNWEKMWYQYSGHIHPVMTKEPEITIESQENYKGTGQTLSTIKVKYPELPIVKMGEHDETCYALASVIVVKTAGYYTDLTTTDLVNRVAVQFNDDKGQPIKLEGLMAKPDDGEIFPDVTNKKGEKVFVDIDNDSDTKSATVVAAESTAKVTIFYSGAKLVKYIKADDYDNHFKEYTQTYAGHNYTHKLQFFSDLGAVKNVVIYDSIEQAYKEKKFEGLDHWNGTLYGVDVKAAKEKFPSLTVYVNTAHYYTDEEFDTNYDTGYAGLTPEDLTAENNWQVIDPDTYTDWANVKTIAFSIGKDVVFGQGDDVAHEVSVYLKMKAPDTIHPQQTKTTQVLAYNAPSYYSEKKGSGEYWIKDVTTANVVTIGLKSATAQIPAISKTMTGNVVPAGFEDTCTFDIKPVGTAAAPRAYKDGTWGSVINSVDVKVNADSKTAVANDNGSILFTEPGTYEYEISEKAGSKAGVEYSKAKYKVSYEVTDERRDIQYDDNTELAVKQTVYKTHDTDGTALAQPLEVTGISFENKYTPAAVSFDIPAVSKKISGAARPSEKTFTFAVQPYQTPGGKIPPKPEETTVTITGEGSASFGAVQFTQAGQYNYIIFEAAAGEKGYTYDSHGFRIDIDVVDDGGRLKVDKVTKTRLEADTLNAEAAEKVEFVNVYSPAPSNTVDFPEVLKQFTGTQRPDEKEFSFTLNAKNGAPLPASSKVSIKGAGKAAFGKISFNKAGTYVYEITEDDLDATLYGYTKDETVYTYTVTVTDEGGTLNAVGRLTKDGEEASAVIFVNDYTPQACSITFPVVVKQIDGPARNEEKMFSFELTSAQGEDNPMPKNTKAAVIGEGSTVSFGEVTFDKEGIYTYEIREADLDDTYVGYTKDESVYKLVITVKNVDGKLAAAYTLTRDGEEASIVKFVNKYAPKGAETDFEIEKKVTGDAPAEKQTYTFEISGEQGAPLPDIARITLTGEGKVAFGKWTYTQAGTYVYRVYEIAGSDTTCAYDKTVYIITDTVTDNGGVLEMTRTVTADGKEVKAAVFENKYEKPKKDKPKNDKPESPNPQTGNSHAGSTCFGAVLMIAGVLCVIKLRTREEE